MTMTLRHKLATRLGAAVLVVFMIGWAVSEPEERSVVGLALAVLGLVVSLRALIVVQDDVVYERGVIGWRAQPLVLHELTGVTLHRTGHRGIALQLIVTTADEVLMLDCVAWSNWRDLAHLVGHFARRLDADLDETTARRLACTRHRCPTDAHVAEAIARTGRPKPTPPMRIGPGAAAWLTAASAATGAALTLCGAWLRDADDTGPLLPIALGGAAVFALIALLFVIWQNAAVVKGAIENDPGSPSGPDGSSRP